MRGIGGTPLTPTEGGEFVWKGVLVIESGLDWVSLVGS